MLADQQPGIDRGSVFDRPAGWDFGGRAAWPKAPLTRGIGRMDQRVDTPDPSPGRAVGQEKLTETSELRECSDLEKLKNLLFGLLKLVMSPTRHYKRFAAF